MRGADARRQVQERLNLALSNAEIIGLWDWDVRRDRIVVDQRFARMFGVTPDQATSGTSIRAFLDGVHPEDRSRLKQEIAAALRTGLPLSTEYRLLSPDGAVCDVVARGQCQRSPTGEPLRFPGVVVDVTEQRRAERALAELNAELEQRVEERTRELMVAEESIRQLQKMEAIGQLTGGIAHDFNNLLTGISGSLDLIRRRLAAGRSDDLDRFIDAAINSAQRAAALTHRLLAFARRQSLDITSQDINTLISGMADLLNRALGETIEVTTELDPALWPALTDANQFESALLNLAINARDAMPGGGRLAIETRNRHLSAAQTAAQELAPGDYVLIAVRDNGEGMSPDILSKAFDPFFTTKPIGAGTGLGLSMIYGFARQSGGHVEIESRVGVGTTVTLYLPRAAYDAANSEPCIEKAPPEGRGETVLVVEDEPAVRLLIGEVLRDLGYQKLEVQDAATAFPILDSERPIDLLITDVGLPLVDGRQLAEIAREKRPGLKILFVTGYAEKAAQRNQFLEPGMEMMAKPFALEALATKVRELLTG
ncbi:ATP-binding protein [Rhodopila sp.]|uniref:ATP-binding protein n=1 Tax=Rhodopila sp. TaxID=2480087 RepID=UPI002B961FB5|nr:ATP-binding protein [Rhodopila sp.]HVZ07947.1 ATP-binding protein [Rhodopila sp.]